MRALLTELGEDVRNSLKSSETPRQRLATIIDVNFSEKQFAPGTVAAWLAFYMEAHRTAAVHHLLTIYARRLHSNLMYALVRLTDRADAEEIAEGIAALIDGLYIRRALKNSGPDRASAITLISDYADTMLAKKLWLSRGN